MPNDQRSDAESVKQPDKKKTERVLDAKARLAEAEAELIEAKTKLAKAKTPLVDKIILRGLIPIALAIVGPWALWKFDTDNQVTREAVVKQGETLTKQAELTAELQQIVTSAETFRAKREREEIEWRKRMHKLEKEKSEEISELASMVTSLDRALKMALLGLAIERSIQADYARLAHLKSLEPTDRISHIKKDKERYVIQAMRQVQWDEDSDIDQDQTRELANEVFDRYVEQEQQQMQTD